jgi:hypothetical protein
MVPALGYEACVSENSGLNKKLVRRTVVKAKTQMQVKFSEFPV